MNSLPLLVSYPARRTVVRAMAGELGLGRQETAQAVTFLDDGLPPLTRTSWLPFLFGVSPKLTGAMAVKSEKYYRRFRIPKRRGGYRELVTPRRFLKTVQRWLLHQALVRIPVSPAAHGFVRGRSIFTNAAGHVRHRNLMTVDVRDFFPTVTETAVEDLLAAHFPYPAPVLSQLAGLCTLDGCLPQGAPTSPHLANAAFSEVDGVLLDLAEEWGVYYSRYADDLAFSGDRLFSPEDREQVAEIAAQGGFNLHPEKGGRVGSGARQLIAGLVVNDVCRPPREKRRRWRAMFHRAAGHPHEFHDRVDELAGIASFVRQYAPHLAASYEKVVDSVRADFDTA